MSENRFCCCPHCHTIYRLSEENLNRQTSHFRCHVCREVFDSRIHTVSKTDPGFVSGPPRLPDTGDKRDRDMAYTPGDNRASGGEADQINDGSMGASVFSDSTGVEVEESGKSFEDGKNGFDQPKLPTQPVLEEVPLAWMSENTAYEYIKDRREPLIALAWCVASVGLFILLSLQIKYFYVEKFAQDQSFRKYLVGFCKIASCELPPLESPDLFTIANTKVDLHPTQPDALRVTVKLFNRAGYSQPYPDLRITLTDRAGRVVGRRSFPPPSYLAAGSENMVGDGELVSLLFDLSRPHEKAVGFAVDIVTD